MLWAKLLLREQQKRVPRTSLMAKKLHRGGLGLKMDTAACPVRGTYLARTHSK